MQRHRDAWPGPAAFLRAALVAGVTCYSSGCHDANSPGGDGGPGHGSATTAPGPGADSAIPPGPSRAHTVYAVTGDTAQVIMDLGPDLGPLASLDAAGQEKHLLRWALHQLAAEGMQRAEFQGKDHFTVRMIVVADRDEYNRPRRFELALLETDRATLAGLDPAALDALPTNELARRFTARRLSLDNVAKAAQKKGPA